VWDMVEVTSMNRPDPNWVFTDKEGHVHQWHDSKGPATNYSPMEKYSVPTVRSVIEGSWVDDDGEEHHICHLACRQCGERVNPGRTADTCRQFIPGLRRQ
jgi:hypothetical protein